MNPAHQPFSTTPNLNHRFIDSQNILSWKRPFGAPFPSPHATASLPIHSQDQMLLGRKKCRRAFVEEDCTKEEGGLHLMLTGTCRAATGSASHHSAPRAGDLRQSN